jgi:ADP-ribose pyrophosphatase YjhB (NUDIX family)
MNDRHKDVAVGVQVLAIVKDKNKKDCVLLCFEKRPSYDGMFDVIVNLPSGTIGDKDNNNTIEKAAEDELKEETGYRLDPNRKPTVLSPMLAKDHSANSDIISFVKVEGVEKIPDAEIGEADEKDIIAHTPMLVPIDEIDEQLKEWTEKGIVFEDGKRKSCIVTDQIYSALYLYKQDKEKNAKKT